MLTVIYKAVVLVKILHAIPPWWGGGSLQHLTGRDLKLVYVVKFYQLDYLTITQPGDDKDKTLFAAVMHNNKHALHYILPNYSYSLRSRRRANWSWPPSVTLETSLKGCYSKTCINFLVTVYRLRFVNLVYDCTLTPSTPAVPNCCSLKGSAPYWSDPPFLISDIRALWRSVLSARAPECQKLKMVGQSSMAKCKALTGKWSEVEWDRRPVAVWTVLRRKWRQPVGQHHRCELPRRRTVSDVERSWQTLLARYCPPAQNGPAYLQKRIQRCGAGVSPL